MKEIKAYECSDGMVKNNKRDALVWERTLELRGLIQSTYPTRGGEVTLTPTQVAAEIVKNFKDINKIYRSYQRKIAGAEQAIAAKIS